MKEIVVGIDGSESAGGALREAGNLARLEGAKLRLVTVWHVPSPAYGSAFGFPLADLRGEFKAGAQHIADEGVNKLRSEGNGIPVESVVKEGHPAKVLLEEAEDADLLVVGSRGHGGFSELLLGSVSRACTRHAHCPVVVVRQASGPNGTRPDSGSSGR
jgi:nucleotide-binding universal stress UspA family protein